MRTLFWIFSLAGGVIGALFILTAFIQSSAPQQAAIAAIGIGIGVIPYCIARAVSELVDKSADQRQAQISLLTDIAAQLRGPDAHVNSAPRTLAAEWRETKI